MAESDTILQLGIEAAREGNREEARNLFGLLTRQEPENAQAWLWLAGVAESPEERRAALERVLALEPNNEMAIKGLQAMGAPPPGADQPAERVVAPTQPVETPGRPLSDDEQYAANLDTAYDEYDTVEKAAPPPREEASARDTAYGEEAGGGTTARERVETRRNRRQADEEEIPARRGPSPLLLGLIALILLIAIGLIGINLLNRNRQAAGGNIPGGIAGTATSTATAGATETGTTFGTASTSEATAAATVPGATAPVTPTVEATSSPTLTPTVEATPPPAPAPPPPTPDLAAASPAPVDPGAVLEASGWSYTFPQANYAALLGNQLGGATSQGNFVVVLVNVANNTGTGQPLPPDFFVVKDAQGRVFTPQPQLSSAYLIRGVNADLSLEDSVPANGLFTSIPLIFDLPSGATNLVLFAKDKPDQGWPLANIGAVP